MKGMDTRTPTAPTRRPWQEPTLNAIGAIGDVLKNGKPSMSPGDPGEPNKNTQHG